MAAWCFPRRAARLLLCGLCLAAVAGPAAAQDPLRRGPVALDRPSPDFDPLGLRIGSFLLFPELTVTTGYTSNLFAEPDDVVSDFFIETRPVLSLRSQWSRHQLDVDVAGEIRRHLDQTTENREDGSLRVGGQLDVTREFRVNGQIDLARETEERGTVDDEGVIESPRVFDRLAGTLEATRDFDQVRIGLATAIDRRDFRSDEDEDRDRTDYRVIPRLEYEVSPSLRIFTTGEVEVRRFDTVVDVNFDSVNFGGSAGTVFDIDNLVTGIVQVGVARTDFDDGGLEDQTNLTTRGEVIWVPTPLTTVRASIDRSVVPTSVANAGSRTSTVGGVSVDHDLLRNLTLGLETAYRVDDVEAATADDTFTDDTISLDATAEWRLNRWLGLEFAYEFDRRDSTDADRDFTRNQVFLRLRLQR